MLFPTSDTNAVPSLQPTTGTTEPFARILGHALAYKGWLAISALLGLLLSILLLTVIPPVYEAQAVVIMDSRRNKLADDESALSTIVVDQYYGALKSELELILSPDLARHVISSLNLLETPSYASAIDHVATATRFAQLRVYLLGLLGVHDKPVSELSAAAAAAAPVSDPEMENAVKIFRTSFWAENEPKSLTIRLGYKSESPELAAAITNAALKRYLATDEEIKTAALERSEAWLEDRIAILRKSSDAADQSVERFRAGNQLATSRDQSPLQLDLLQLESMRVDAQAAVAAAQAKVARAAQGAEALASADDVLASPLIQGLRLQEATLISEQTRLASTLLPDHPSLRRIGEELARLRGTIQGEVHRIAQGNVDGLRQAQLRLTNVSSQIRALRDRIDVANSADIQLRALEQDAAAKRAVLATFIKRHDQEAGTPLTPPDSRVVSWATVPVDPISPRYGLSLLEGVFGAMLLAFVVSMGFERLRRGFSTLRELEEELGLVVAGLTPALRRLKVRPFSKMRSGDVPPMRELALTVRALAHTPSGSNALVVLVTSAVAGEGKSMMAISLARSVANGGQRCLLIDGDIRKPTLHTALGVAATPGLVELTLDHAPLVSVTRPISPDGFDFLSAGRPTPDPLSPFTIEAFGRALTELKRGYDVIVIDSAPVLLASESLVVSGYANLTLFIVKWRTTPREIVRKAALLLTRSSAGPCLSVLAQTNIKRLGRDERRMEVEYRRAYQAH